MPPPTTRARAPSSDIGAHPQFSKITPSAPAAPQVAAAVSASLAHVVDDGPVTGRDVKELRDVTAQAITDVWTDSRQATANLAGKINATNASLLADLNESFSAMGHRIDGLPSAVNITTPIPIPSLPSFSGLDEDPTQFSAWLARVEDIFDMLSPPLSSAMKAKLVKGHLQGLAREKLNQLTSEQRDDYDTLVAELRKSFEGPHRRRLARQALAGCRQQPGESCFSFANRILHLVRAITAGQDPVLQEERLLEEFVSRLRTDIKFHVRNSNPTSFQQALDTADAVEQHLAETISDRLITPSAEDAPVAWSMLFRGLIPIVLSVILVEASDIWLTSAHPNVSSSETQIRVDLTRGHLAMDDLSPQQQLEALVAHALARDENPDATQRQQEQASDTSSSVMQNVYLDYPEEALLASDVESMNLSPASSLTLTASPPPGPSTDTQNLLIVPVPSTEEAKWTTVRDKPPTSTPSGSPHGSTRRRRASSPLFAEEMLHEEPLAVPSSSSYHDHPFDIPAQPIQDDIVSLRERLFNTDMQGVSLLRPGTRPPIKHVLTPQRRPPPTFTPEGHSHYLIEHHPWAHLVSPRPIDVLQSRAIQPVLDLPTEEYRHLPSGGYRNTRFARSLFPRIAIRAHCPVLQIPFIELQHLEDTIAFRDRTLRMIEDLQDGTYDDFREIDSPVQPDRLRCMLAPETWRGRRPVLPNKEEREWLLDRADRFDNFESDHSVALIKMLKLFNVTGAAHAALPFLSDDHQTHWVAAVVPSLTVYTIRLNFVLHNMANEAGWAAQRPVAVWIAGSASLAFVRVRSVTMDPDQRTLAISTEAYHYSHRSILGDVAKHARRVGPNLVVDVGVHLIKSPLASNPVYESISRADLSITAPAGTFGDGVMNAMYGRARIGCSPRHSQAPVSTQLTSTSFSLKGRRISLNDDQQKAISLAFTGYPVVGIQAAFGTGKTVIGALLAAHLCKANISVIVTSTTNAAVAQFAETFLALDDFNDVPMVRYVSDSATAAENAYTTPSDLNVILKGLGEKYEAKMTSTERNRCHEFKEGRDVLEQALRDPERALQMSEEQSEECYISDKYVSRNLQKMVDLMFRLHAPAVIFATTSSLINIIGPKGIFRKHMSRFSVLIGDEASQIPEPVVVTLAMRLPTVRHVYIGDAHQLQPHVRCPRSSNMAIFGARSVMEILMKARAVPIAPLRTTFRGHPSLLELPNRVAYSGALVSGVRAEERQMLLTAMKFPSPGVPYMFINVPADSTRSTSKSHFNTAEAEACWHLVHLLLENGISKDDIAIITFYRAQFNRMQEQAQRLGVELATVDSVQGREKEVVIILTTRTDAELGTAEFLDDYRRMNVALTRCRQGQFVFGHAEALSRIPFWSRVLSWSRSLNAVVDHNRIDEYFHNHKVPSEFSNFSSAF
ncbi:unnamed protein product [Cylicocyclus nassatus]|uniref:Uncharacterized protein n=1 Tax=Cylicocyclus nassatus TaxID=53992 RepID=A0AA36HH25_CYLNA|nr:unnamed protein product [Cylicocyclus nassatus]